jgi:hypothetical protein
MFREGRARTGFLGLTSALILVMAAGTVMAGPWPWLHHRDQGPPCTLADLGRSIDATDREIRAAGTIVIKQPDVWGQDRMTSFRRDFDLRMRGELDRFQPVLSGQVARSDSLSIAGQAVIGGSVGVGAASGQGVPAGMMPGLTPPPPLLAPLPGSAALSLEPTVALDERKRFLDHDYELLRVNLGDDTADAAGYGLYLFRLPVAIDPAGPTCKGWGGLLTVTVRHEFGCAFLVETFRNLVVNDLVDLLAPIIVELIRSDGWRPRLAEFEEASLRYRRSNFAAAEMAQVCNCMQQLTLPISPTRLWKGYYPIASADLTNVLLVESFYRIAAEVQDRLHTNAPRGSEVRNLLRQELEVAYELMRGHDVRNGPLADIGLIEAILQQIQTRQFEGRPGDRAVAVKPGAACDPQMSPLAPAYRLLMSRLPGNLEQRALGSLCWAIAVEAGLLNRQVREDMWRHGGTKTFVCPADLPNLYFYPPHPTHEATAAFREYVKVRWPLVALALDPVTDQQNIADAYQRSRDLELALTAAFASGKIGARALASQMRHVRYDADALVLNRTVTAFGHGADTFGWRFYPRYQTPREEMSPLHALGEALVGGFEPSKAARLEPGQRELTAAIIVPSFLRSIRIDTASNWFKLSDPLCQRLQTGQMLEQGRHVVLLREGLACAGDAGQYRVDDLNRVAIRIDQLERMLPLQTHVLDLPYDHTLGGFELFTQGAMSLIPELVGYEGIEGVDPSRVTDLLLVGKHLSLSGTRVIVSGVNVPEEYIDFISRRALRVRLPIGLAPTTTIPAGATTTPAYEVFVVTPSGTSNRLVIPWVAPLALPVPLPTAHKLEPTPPTPPPPAPPSPPSHPHRHHWPSEQPKELAPLPPALPSVGGGR